MGASSQPNTKSDEGTNERAEVKDSKSELLAIESFGGGAAAKVSKNSVNGQEESCDAAGAVVARKGKGNNDGEERENNNIPLKAETDADVASAAANDNDEIDAELNDNTNDNDDAADLPSDDDESSRLPQYPPLPPPGYLPYPPPYYPYYPPPMPPPPHPHHHHYPYPPPPGPPGYYPPPPMGYYPPPPHHPGHAMMPPPIHTAGERDHNGVRLPINLCCDVVMYSQCISLYSLLFSLFSHFVFVFLPHSELQYVRWSTPFHNILFLHNHRQPFQTYTHAHQNIPRHY
jgi:hypothetical protein